MVETQYLLSIRVYVIRSKLVYLFSTLMAGLAFCIAQAWDTLKFSESIFDLKFWHRFALVHEWTRYANCIDSGLILSQHILL